MYRFFIYRFFTDPAASAEGAMHDDEEENLEIDFEYDVPDLRRDALAALLAAAGVHEHGDFGM